MIKLIRSELRKILTTNLWWIFLIVVLVLTTLALLLDIVTAHQHLFAHPDFGTGAQAEQQRKVWEEQRDVPGQMASIYTAGQFFGLLFTMLLGALVVTNEFFHQTATTTFLTTPRRSRVIGAKLITGIGVGAFFWLLTTVLNLAVGLPWVSTWGLGTQLGSGTVWRAMLLSLLGYAIWAVFGIGLGVLIRSQIATVVLAIVIYFVTGTLAQTIAQVLDYALHWHWALKAIVVLPGTASNLMIQGISLSGNPPQWLGGVVLVGWGIAAGVIGTWLTRRRDVG
jgi:ABC-2 type transport system permease protein